MNVPDTASNEVRLERVLHAPAAEVWAMWTNPEHFAAWYGPTGATVVVADLDLRVGGRRLVRMEMETPGGVHEMWFTGEHLEVDEARRLVYTESIGDADGNVQSPAAVGMPADHPVTTTVTVELEAVDDDTTRMVLIHAGIAPDSPGAAGWTMALDELARRLA